MQLIPILIQLLLIFEIVIFINGFLFSKPTKSNHHLIAAKYDPEMPKRVRTILEQVGDNAILKIQLGRTPVEAVLLLFLNLISAWKFSEKQLELGYDEIYHNYLLVTIQNEQTINTHDQEAIERTVYKLDKAQRVRLMEPIYPTDYVDVYDVPLTPDKTFTLNRLITTASNVDKHFYTYDAGNNNMCQTFVENIVDINGLTSNIVDERTRMALKPQDAKTLVATLGSRSDIVKRITDLGGTLDTWVFDRKIKWKEPVNKEFALFGDMHVKVAHHTTDGNNEEILGGTGNAVIVNGTTDIFLENEDQIYNAVIALESTDKKTESKRQIAFIIGIILAVISVIAAVVALVYFLWRKSKNKLRQKELIRENNIDKTKSDTNLSEISDASEKE